jgi:hypothetical protein
MEIRGNTIPAWKEVPRLLSLWDMEQFFAERFHSIGWVLGYMQGFGEFGGTTDMPEPSIDVTIRALESARADCESVGLRVCVVHISEVLSMLRTPSSRPQKAAELVAAAQALHQSVNREMKVTKFFRLSPDTQFYFDKSEAFGPEVSVAFPSASYDVTEAGNCLALGRGTAAVFHAMRVLEHGLCALAGQFGVPFEHRSWHGIIEEIERAIRAIGKQPNKPPNWKDDEQFYSEAASQFMHFKNGWRNYTAHAVFKYTETEAEAIYRHVRDFMRHISKRLKEPKTP